MSKACCQGTYSLWIVSAVDEHQRSSRDDLQPTGHHRLAQRLPDRLDIEAAQQQLRSRHGQRGVGDLVVGLGGQ